MSSKLLDRIYNILHPEKPAESDIIDKIYSAGGDHHEMRTMVPE